MSGQSRNLLPLNMTDSAQNSRGSWNTSQSSNLMNSPMTNLTFNLRELSTGRTVPRKKLSLTGAEPLSQNGSNMEKENSLTLKSDHVSWATFIESTTDDSEISSSLTSGDFDHETVVFESESNDASSQDSGLDFEQDRRNTVYNFDDTCSVSSSSSSLSRLPSTEDDWISLDSPSFKTPKGMPPKRCRSLIDHKQFSEDACSPLKYSPVKSPPVPRPIFSEAFSFEQVNVQVPEHSEVGSLKSDADDGFHELFKMEEVTNEASDQLSSLISATLLHRPGQDRPEEPVLDVQDTSKKVMFLFGSENSTPSGKQTTLLRSQSLDTRARSSFKRCDPPLENLSIVQTKKWRGDHQDTEDITEDKISSQILKPRRLQRCHSETEAMIKSAISLMYSKPDLIGDCSKSYCLPTVSGRHQDLKSISAETLSQLLANEFSDVVERYHIIDCRYPYEFEGGHIQTAMNVYTKEHIMDKFIRSPVIVDDPNKRIILIFHCEFSSERGPSLFRFLRQQDRETNKEQYPVLHYPEMYLLEGGYKQFFEHYSHLCEPRQYKTMFDKNHVDDLRKFRAKCKSWSDDKTQARAGARNLKF